MSKAAVVSLTTSSRVRQVPDQVSSSLSGEAVILNLVSGTYYGLNPLGARIWDLIGEERTLAEIRDAILQEYEVAPERCMSDIRELVEKLATEGLVEIEPNGA
jgi:hypothetical protein